MASSQIQVVPSSPFGCVLRDRNRRDSNDRIARSALKKNLKQFIREHLLIDENSRSITTNNNVDSWVADRQADGNRQCLRPLKKNKNANNANKDDQEPAQILAKPVLTDAAYASTQSEKQNLGASSLVQMWEARLNRSQSLKSCSRTSSGISYCESGQSIADPPAPDTNSCEETLSLDWEAQSDRTAASDLPCPGSSVTTEKERVRIADIIKRLKHGNEDKNENEQQQVNNGGSELPCRERRPNCTLAVPEQRGFQLQQIVSSPRLRGRQAFNDLLMQMQRERHVEVGTLEKRQAVSKFSQRGRIQSLLKLRCLQRCNAIQDHCRNHSLMNRSPEQSSIKNLRGKFSKSAVTARSGGDALKSVPQQMSSSGRSLEATSASTSDPLTSKAAHLPEEEETSGQSTTGKFQDRKANVACSEQPNQQLDIMQRNGDCHDHEQPQEALDITERNGDFQEQPEAPLDINSHSENLESKNLDSKEAAAFSNSTSENTIPRESESDSKKHLFLESQERETSKPMEAVISCTPSEIVIHEHDTDHQHFLYLQSPETTEAVTSYNDWDEHEITEQDEADYDPYYMGSSYDWISEIARPKSYWEDLRKTWYQQVLATSGNEEIRQLLERRTVSTFLTSDFRERMDKLMQAKLQLEPADSVYGEDLEEDRSPEIISFLQRHLQPQDAQEEEEHLGEQEVDDEVGVEEEEEEEEGEASPFFDPSSPSMPLASPFMRSWSYQDRNDLGDDSDRLFSSCSPSASPPVAPSQVQSYKHSPRSSSVTNHPSLEMELICGLRGQMEQLHSEMAELRKSVLSCIDLQMKMQQSFSKEAHSVGMKSSNSSERLPWKRSCCMCYEMPVDSLLYRCGHMCTCLRCARELQWNGGNCPICKAPIADVVRAYLDS